MLKLTEQSRYGKGRIVLAVKIYKKNIDSETNPNLLEGMTNQENFPTSTGLV